MAVSWNPEIQGPGRIHVPHAPTRRAGGAPEIPAAAAEAPGSGDPREHVEMPVEGGPRGVAREEGPPGDSRPSREEEPAVPIAADAVPAEVRSRFQAVVDRSPSSLVGAEEWTVAAGSPAGAGSPARAGGATLGGAEGAVAGVPGAGLVATPAGSLHMLDCPSPAGAVSAAWNEDAIRSFTARGIPIRDFRTRADRPEWQVDTGALRRFLEADAARSPADPQAFSVDYRGEGVPQADCTLAGPGPGGGCTARLSFADGRTIGIVSDGPLKREHITNVARTVGESNPRMFRSRFPGQGDTTVLVADHLGQFTSRGHVTDVGGLGGNGPTITLDRMMLDSEEIGSLTHEWMHSFDHAAFVLSRKAQGSDGRPLFGPEGSSQAGDFVGAYARTNPLEDFAETGEWVNDVLVKAHRSGTDLVRAGGEAFRRWMVDHWSEVRPDRSEAAAPRLLEKAGFIYRTLDLAPDTPVRFTLQDGALPVDADRASELRRDVQVMAANHPGIRSAEVEVGNDARTYRLRVAQPDGGTTTATVRVPHGAQTDLATTAPLLAYGDVQVRAPENVYVPTVELTPREGSGLAAGRATTVLGADLYMEGEGGPAARLDRVLHYGMQHGTARDLVVHVGVDELSDVAPALRQALATGFPGVDRVTLVDCQGRTRTVEAVDAAGGRLPLPREVEGRAFGDLPAHVRAENAAREAAEAARIAALAPRPASAREVEAVGAKVKALSERVRAMGDTPEAAEASEMLAMLGEMLAAPSMSEEELGSILAEVMQWSSRLGGTPR